MKINQKKELEKFLALAKKHHQEQYEDRVAPYVSIGFTYPQAELLANIEEKIGKLECPDYD